MGLTRLFGRGGLPAAIRVDNGAPFGGQGALGLSRLSVWGLRLGIRVEFTRRVRPGDQNICYPQNLAGRGIAILELSTNDLHRMLAAPGSSMSRARRLQHSRSCGLDDSGFRDDLWR